MVEEKKKKKMTTTTTTTMLMIQWRIILVQNKVDNNTIVKDTSLSPPFVVRGRLGVRIQFTNKQKEDIYRLVNIRYAFEPKKTFESTWYPLDVMSTFTIPESYDGIRVRFSGQFFIWSTPLINLYHFLLLSVFPYVFSSSENLASSFLEDSIWEKDTLCLILASDRLRKEEKDILQSTLQWWRVYSMREDLGLDDQNNTTLMDILGYIRWGFIRMETIIQFLAMIQSKATQIQLIQVIQRALTHDHLMIPRRAPWGMKYNPNQQITTRQNFEALCKNQI
jgi:hypothetical protein